MPWSKRKVLSCSACGNNGHDCRTCFREHPELRAAFERAKNGREQQAGGAPGVPDQTMLTLCPTLSEIFERSSGGDE